MTGTEDTYFYEGTKELKSVASAWDKFPTAEEPNNKYKFSSVHVSINMNLRQVNRSTYSLLDWLGDCGGLYDALHIIGLLLTSPFSSFAAKQVLARTIVKYEGRKPPHHPNYRGDFSPLDNTNRSQKQGVDNVDSKEFFMHKLEERERLMRVPPWRNTFQHVYLWFADRK